jgi:hypothetical protein
VVGDGGGRSASLGLERGATLLDVGFFVLLVLLFIVTLPCGSTGVKVGVAKGGEVAKIRVM